MLIATLCAPLCLLHFSLSGRMMTLRLAYQVSQSLLPFLVHLRLFCYDITISDIAHSLSAFCCQACRLRHSKFSLCRCLSLPPGLLGVRASASKRLKEEAPPKVSTRSWIQFKGNLSPFGTRDPVNPSPLWSCMGSGFKHRLVTHRSQY